MDSKKRKVAQPRGDSVVVSNLSKTISKHYRMEPKDAEYLLYIVRTWAVDGLDSQFEKMNKLLNGMKPYPSKVDRSAYKGGEIASIVGESARDKIVSILDIGAGTGDVLLDVKKILAADYAYALDPKGGIDKKGIMSIDYTTTGNIDLPDGSVQVIVLAQTIHHIHPSKRAGLLSNVKRLLSPGGVVVIQEHAYTRSVQLHTGLEVLHNFWYAKNGESPDPFYPMTYQECEDLFAASGFVPASQTQIVGWQQMYWRGFTHSGLGKKSNVTEDVTDDTMYITLSSGRRKYNPQHAPEGLVENNLLRTFISVLQSLVTFWDRETAPSVEVVYVGDIGEPVLEMLASMFGDAVNWHVYGEGKQFTNADAKFWSNVLNVFLFIDTGLPADTQMRWVQKIDPYQSCLRMRLPYVEYKDGKPRNQWTEFLHGNVMFESFATKTSTAACLIPVRDSNHKMTTKKWDGVKYEDTLFYYNTKVRTSTVLTTQTQYDYARLLHVLDMYAAEFQVDESADELYEDVVGKLAA